MAGSTDVPCVKKNADIARSRACRSVDYHGQLTVMREAVALVRALLCDDSVGASVLGACRASWRTLSAATTTPSRMRCVDVGVGRGCLPSSHWPCTAL